MRSTFRILLTVICALYLSGAHWTVLQVTAWTGMLVTRTEQVGVAKAVRSTFSGEAPCRLCHVIKEGRQGEQQHDPESPALKKVFEMQGIVAAQVRWHPFQPVAEGGWPEFVRAQPLRTVTPPTPPPLV